MHCSMYHLRTDAALRLCCVGLDEHIHCGRANVLGNTEPKRLKRLDSFFASQ